MMNFKNAAAAFAGVTAAGLIKDRLLPGATVLDVGCGRNSVLAQVDLPLEKTGLDHYAPYIEQSRAKGLHSRYVLGDVRSLPFEDKSFDYAVSSEVIEHLPKEDGFKLIAEMERVARKGILITTPNGLLPAEPGPLDNPAEAHISGWTAGELRAMGFSVRGFGGLKCMKQMLDAQKGRRSLPIRVIARLGNGAAYYCPAAAFQLFGFKKTR